MVVVGWLVGLPGARALAAAPATVYVHGPSDRRSIALTFDDNFRPERALPALAALRDRNVPATMFVVGEYVNALSALDRAMADGGFEIGDHTQSHRKLTDMSYPRMLTEIGQGTANFRARTGVQPSLLFRPPYGATSSSVARAAGERGFRGLILWDIDTNDWQGRSAAQITKTVLTQAHPGAIVLMHLFAAHTFEALPAIIEGLRADGFELVTVSQLLKDGRRYIDVLEGGPMGAAVLRLVDAGVMAGYDDDWFGPADPVTRAQFAKVAVLAAGLHTDSADHPEAPTYSDVRPAADGKGGFLTYPYDFVEEATAAEIIKGRTDESGARRFDPYGTITRGQLAQILARMARTMRGYGDPPPDAGVPGDVPDYAREDVRLTASLRLMSCYADGSFRPWEPAQRGHVALTMTRFLDLPPGGGKG
jgi:peptidoglycan/xylan/chitin deacetylase (PgdA/CDA1 family)